MDYPFRAVSSPTPSFSPPFSPPSSSSFSFSLSSLPLISSFSSQSVRSSPLAVCGALVATLVLLNVMSTKATWGAWSSVLRVSLATDAQGNEAIVTEGRVGGASMVFMVDTAYAGAPVLSTSYLEGRRHAPFSLSSLLPFFSFFPPLPFVSSSLQDRYRFVVDGAMRERANQELPPFESNSVGAFADEARCNMYTSGCTMRLMGIGETTEAQADLLMCPRVSFGNRSLTSAASNALSALLPSFLTSSPSSEIFVSNPLRSSVHILTMDYLLHRSPCVILPRRGAIVCGASRRTLRRFARLSPTFVGGAMRVEMVVGDTPLQIVLDTGAAAALSISADAVSRIRTCVASDPPRRVTQTGVNGERICSDAFFAEVAVGPIQLGMVETLANSHAVEGADGYAGMGLLRALDLWLAPDVVGVRRSGLPPRSSPSLRDGKCEGGAMPACVKKE